MSLETVTELSSTQTFAKAVLELLCITLVRGILSWEI